MFSELKSLIEDVEELKGRVDEVTDLSEMIRRKALPAAPVAAFLIPMGIRGRSEGDAMAGAMIQSIDRLFALVLFLRHAGDVGGGKAIPKLHTLVESVLAAVVGQAPDDTVGVFRLLRGDVLSITDQATFYQLDFAILDQIRN